jgi:hypothetical protein
VCLLSLMTSIGFGALVLVQHVGKVTRADIVNVCVMRQDSGLLSIVEHETSEMIGDLR